MILVWTNHESHVAKLTITGKLTVTFVKLFSDLCRTRCSRTIKRPTRIVSLGKTFGLIRAYGGAKPGLASMYVCSSPDVPRNQLK